MKATKLLEAIIKNILLGGFELHEDTSAIEVVDRLLAMLNQYLISHKHLQLDRSFKVYVKILSSSHSSQKRLTKITKRTIKRKFGKLHVGGRRKQTAKFSQLWGIEIPVDFGTSEPFRNMCLIICSLLGKLQHEFWLRENKKFQVVQYVNSVSPIKKKYAHKLLLEELEKLLQMTNLSKNGPHEIEGTLKLLSELWSAQFFVFEGVAQTKCKLGFMYPNNYDDSLMPIYLYKVHDTNHIIFIQNINSYFKQNGKICLACKKTFKSSRYRHFCKSQQTCFVCHRFHLKPLTFIHSRLNKEFCDSRMSPSIACTCNLCNCKIFSSSCFQSHKRLCNSKGFFGWFCDQCLSFTYCSNGLTSQDLKKRHTCGDLKPCRHCFLPNDLNHLCPLKKVKLDGFHNRLGFFNLQFSHTNELVMALILRESTERGVFDRTSFYHSNFGYSDGEEKSFLRFNYFKSTKIDPKHQKYFEKLKQEGTYDFQANLEKIKIEETNVEKKLLLFFLQKVNYRTTFITMDESFGILVSNVKIE